MAGILTESISKEVGGGVVTVQDITIAAEQNAANYYFDIVTDISLQLQNQITDNWVENNTAIQDHISQSPLILSLRGISGEKVYEYNPEEAQRLLEQARREAVKVGYNSVSNILDQLGLSKVADLSNKLSSLDILFPSASNITQLAMNAYNYAAQSFDRYKTIVSNFLGKGNPMDSLNGDSGMIPEDTRLKEIYRELSGLRATNTPLVVSTPYDVFANMYIQSVILRQGNENFVTDIEMTLKQINFADVIYTEADKNVLSQYNAYAQAQETNNGKAQGVDDSLDSIIGSSIFKKTGIEPVRYNK